MLLAAVSGASRTAAAQAYARASYEQLVADGVAEYDAGHYAEARALFEQAHKLHPNARTLRSLGATAFELKRYARAIVELRAALGDTRKPLTAAQRSEAEALITRARRFVGKIELEISPQDASLFVDGEPVAGPDLMLDLGEHVVSVRAPGYRDAELKLTIDGGEDSTRRVELARVDVIPERAVAAAPPEPPLPSPYVFARPAADQGSGDNPRDESVFGRWWFWTAAGVVVAGAAVGLAFALGGAKSTKTVPATTSNTPSGVVIMALTSR